VDRGEGGQKRDFFLDVINGWPLSFIPQENVFKILQDLCGWQKTGIWLRGSNRSLSWSPFEEEDPIIEKARRSLGGGTWSPRTEV